jgi:hypothetical protein
MSQVVRTIYGSHINTCRMLQRPFSVLPNSTLNQKFNIHANELPALNEYPILGYIGIGNKGATYEVTTNGYVLTTPIPHLPRDASLYNFIPFIVRDINNDISSTERLKYRIRVPITIEGINYVAYYLRKLSIDDVIPSVELRNVDGETITTNSFTPTLSDLSPNPPNISNTDLNNPNGDYLVSTAKVNFKLDQVDISNILDACNIIYGDSRYAVINEIALCTGIDKILQGTFNTTISNYTDTIVTQVSAFISQYHALTATTTEVNINFDIGSVSSLLV